MLLANILTKNKRVNPLLPRSQIKNKKDSKQAPSHFTHPYFRFLDYFRRVIHDCCNTAIPNLLVSPMGTNRCYNRNWTNKLRLYSYRYLSQKKFISLSWIPHHRKRCRQRKKKNISDSNIFKIIYYYLISSN